LINTYGLTTFIDIIFLLVNLESEIRHFMNQRSSWKINLTFTVRSFMQYQMVNGSFEFGCSLTHYSRSFGLLSIYQIRRSIIIGHLLTFPAVPLDRYKIYVS